MSSKILHNPKNGDWAELRNARFSAIIAFEGDRAFTKSEGDPLRKRLWLKILRLLAGSNRSFEDNDEKFALRKQTEQNKN